MSTNSLFLGILIALIVYVLFFEEGFGMAQGCRICKVKTSDGKVNKCSIGIYDTKNKKCPSNFTLKNLDGGHQGCIMNNCVPLISGVDDKIPNPTFI
jgi:hypothetical protein